MMLFQRGSSWTKGSRASSSQYLHASNSIERSVYICSRNKAHAGVLSKSLHILRAQLSFSRRQTSPLKASQRKHDYLEGNKDSLQTDVPGDSDVEMKVQ